MSTKKYIYWRPDVPIGETEKRAGRCWANVHMLVGYNQGTIEDFQNMADELRETFPHARNNEIKCGKVHKSSHVDGFSIIVWNVAIRRQQYIGWFDGLDKEPEYNW